MSFPYAQPSTTSLPAVLATQFAVSHSGRHAGGIMVAGNCGKARRIALRLTFHIFETSDLGSLWIAELQLPAHAR